MVNDSPEQSQKASLSSILVLFILRQLKPEELKGIPVHTLTRHSLRSWWTQAQRGLKGNVREMDRNSAVTGRNGMVNQKKTWENLAMTTHTKQMRSIREKSKTFLILLAQGRESNRRISATAMICFRKNKPMNLGFSLLRVRRI